MKLLILFFLAAAALLAQSQQTDEALIPTSTTTVVNGAAVIEQISLANETTSDVICTIKSKGGSPRILFDDVVYGKQTGKSSVYVLNWPRGRAVPGGLTWSCASSNAIVGQVTYHQ